MEGIIDGSLCHAKCAFNDEHGCVIVWSSGAAEQIEALSQAGQRLASSTDWAALTWPEYNAALGEADRRMKQSNGHSYVQILKTRCQYCGASPQRTTKCRAWMRTFCDELGLILYEKGLIADKQPNAGDNLPLP